MFERAYGLLRCLRTHLELQLALPCPATPRVPPVHSSEGTLRPFGHCAISDYPTILLGETPPENMFGMLVINSPPCTRGPSRRPTRRDGTLSDATGNEPDLLNSFTVSCVLTTWDFWVAVLRPRPKGAYSFHGDSGVAVWIPNMNN